MLRIFHVDHKHNDPKNHHHQVVIVVLLAAAAASVVFVVVVLFSSAWIKVYANNEQTNEKPKKKL